MEEELKIYVRLNRKETSRFVQIKSFLGLRNDTEVLRAIVNDYWREHKEEFPAILEHFNLNEDGVLVKDENAGFIFQVSFKPQGIKCECGVTKCKHTEFALAMPKVQEILRKKGWKGNV